MEEKRRTNTRKKRTKRVPKDCFKKKISAGGGRDVKITAEFPTLKYL